MVHEAVAYICGGVLGCAGSRAAHLVDTTGVGGRVWSYTQSCIEVSFGVPGVSLHVPVCVFMHILDGYIWYTTGSHFIVDVS